MKFIPQFRDFLRDTVNLNDTRLSQLEDRVGAITRAIKGDELGTRIEDTHKQGSWAHRTIIRPQHGREFDADFLIQLEEQPAWEPREYVNRVREVLDNHSTYAGKVARKARCVRVDYAGDCHVDVVPFVVRADGGQIIYRTDNAFEPTNPTGFTDWYRERNKLTDGDLKRVIRLVKYLRDIKGTFSVKSVILTTLLGDRVNLLKSYGADYSDLPTTLATLMDDLAAYLELNPTMPPRVRDPSDDAGLRTFDHRWDPTTYPNLVKQIRYYADKINDALAEDDRVTSMGLWRDVFGDAFAEDLREAAALASVSKAARMRAPKERFIDEAPFGYKIASPLPATATIHATVVPKAGFRKRGDLAARGHQVERRRELVFKVTHTADRARPTQLYWKVRNRDHEAADAGDLRGEIRRDEGAWQLKEQTSYRGSHYVGAYIIQDGRCVATARCPVIVV